MRLLREPLVHFLLLGGLLFALFAVRGRRDATPDPSSAIQVSAGLVENLALSFERSGGRRPSPTELDGLIEDYVREEVLCREAIALGLDRDDPIVRRRLRQRMEFFAEEDATVATPTETELQEILAANPKRFSKAGSGEVPSLADVREAVERAWRAARRQQALDAAYVRLREKYTVKIDHAPPTTDGTGKKTE